jgi:hypothetical protein
MIFSFLLVKKRQAEVALAFQAAKIEGAKERQIDLFLQMKRLNAKGRDSQKTRGTI